MKGKKRLSSWLILVISVLMFGITVYAGGATASLKVASGSMTVIQTAHENASSAVGLGENGIISIDGSNNIVYFHGSNYIALDYDIRSAYMETLLKNIKASSLGAKEKNAIYNFIASQDTEVSQALKYLTEDTKTDLVNARKWLAPFTGGISTFTGLLTLLIFLFLSIGILMDVAYLALPGLQLILERGNDKKKPFGVSVEAWRVNKEIAMDYKNTKNEVTEYLKKRVPVIIVCAICIGYLVSGKVYEALTYMANAFSNI